MPPKFTHATTVDVWCIGGWAGLGLAIIYQSGMSEFERWEIWGHEFAHAIGRNEYGEFAYGNIFTFSGREWDATRRLNILRMYYFIYPQIKF